MNELILASASPRRRAFLQQLALAHRAVSVECDETLDKALTPDEGVRQVAERKARAASTLYGQQNWILAADTIVVVDDTVLGKPTDRGDARRMLAMLSGRAHRVVTGVALTGPWTDGQPIRSLSVSTEVCFQALRPSQIEGYAATDEPLDKAGAYAIQGLAAAFIRSINGSYSNVVGLPLVETVELLEQAGFSLWASEGQASDNG